MNTAILTSVFAAVPLALPQEGWMEDVGVLLSAVQEIHPAPFRVHDEGRWEEEVRRFEQSLPEMAEHERVLGLARILALAADGHTEPVNLAHPSLAGWFPVIPRRFADGWFVRYAHRDYVELFGRRIVRFAGVPIEEVVARVRPFVSVDNEIGALDPIGNMMRSPAVLHAAGVTPERPERIEIATLDEATGEELVVEVAANGDSWVNDQWLDADFAVETPEPLYLRLDGNYDFAFLEDEGLLYVLFDSVRDDEGETIEAFFGRVFELVEGNEVERFVLDIRENGGGNNYLNYPILHGLIRSKVNRPGRLFVVIGRDTFSAAMCLAVALERHTHAIFVGEPTGATPNHHGDTREIVLPHSGLAVEISELYWQNSDPRDRRPWITPDLPAPLTSRQFFAHRDPALEAILGYVHDPAAAVPPTAVQWRRPSQRLEAVWPGLVGD